MCVPLHTMIITEFTELTINNFLVGKISFPTTIKLNSQSTMGLTEMVDLTSYLTLQALGYLYSRKTKVRGKLNFLSGKITVSI